MPAHGYARTRGVRWNRQTLAFEMWCPDCASKGGAQGGPTFWPLTHEFWDVHNGLSRCRACQAEKKRREERGRRALKRDELNAANRAYYAANRELLRWKDNQRKAERRERAA